MSDNGFDIEPTKKGGLGEVEFNETVVDPVLDPRLRAKAERALTWKLDMRLMPMIALIFIVNYIGKGINRVSAVL